MSPSGVSAMPSAAATSRSNVRKASPTTATTQAEKDDAERERLLSAAKELLERSGWWGFKIQSLLRHANLSTRCFYRHFEKKSDLLLALFEKEFGGATERLRRVTAVDPSAPDRIRAYIRTIIAMAYHAETARPSSLFASHWHEMLPDYGDAIDRCINEMIEPLATAILDGVRSGTVSSPAPQVDARAIFYFVASVAADQAVTGGATPREQIEDMVVPFVERAIGL